MTSAGGASMAGMSGSMAQDGTKMDKKEMKMDADNVPDSAKMKKKETKNDKKDAKAAAGTKHDGMKMDKNSMPMKPASGSG
ncbi:MAG: hypothetical protein GXP59_09530 [Deltaproteobacteria bacterium]|nr:hypothetical protein [Deltaproteobacteria bacterium]